MFLLRAEKVRLQATHMEPITSGSVKAYLVKFEFSSDWDGLTRVAVFAAGSVSRSVLLGENNECEIPWEVLAEPGFRLDAGVYGTNENSVVLPTVWVNLGVILVGTTTGEEAKPPIPDLWEQELGKKGDGLGLTDNRRLGLYSGSKLLSSVDISGEVGEDGATFTPSVSEDGTLSWTNDRGLPNPDPVNIKGADGANGKNGKDGKPGPAGKDGNTGPEGQPGRDATINGVNTITIQEGTNVTITQVGDILTINATGVSSFNGRVGSVIPKTGDYTPEMVGAPTIEEVNTAIDAAITGAIDEAY